MARASYKHSDCESSDSTPIGRLIAAADDMLRQQQFDNAISVLTRVIHRNPALPAAYRMRAKAFSLTDHPDEAISDCKHALSLVPGDREIEDLRARSIEMRRRRTRMARRRSVIGDFTIDEFLGAGREGAVYKCRDGNGKPYIVKVFHAHRAREMEHGSGWHRKPVTPAGMHLRRLSRTLQRHVHPAMNGFDTLDTRERIEAVYYPFQRLYRINKRDENYIRKTDFAGALLRTALSLQGHLIRHAMLLKSDMNISQYMIDRRGRFQYIDYGPSIIPASDFRCTEDKLHVTTLLRLIYRLFNPRQADLFYDRSPGRHFTGRNFEAIFDRDAGLLDARDALPCIEPIFDCIATGDYRPFSDPAFYEHIAASMPEKLSRAKTTLFIAGLKLKRVFKARR
jgi:hypothetical protein